MDTDALIRVDWCDYKASHLELKGKWKTDRPSWRLIGAGSKSFSEEEKGKNNVQLNNFEAEQGNAKLKEKKYQQSSA